MIYILLILTVTLCNISCFFMGAMLKQKADKGETIQAPTFSPLKTILEHRESRQEEKERERLETVLRNIERYDGTGSGQEDIPV